MRKKELEKHIALLNKKFDRLEIYASQLDARCNQNINATQDKFAKLLIDAGLLVQSERVIENSIYFDGQRYIIKKEGK